MKWTDAIKKASKLVLKQDEQGAKRIEKPKRRKGKK
jgi:hypothetical protein